MSGSIVGKVALIATGLSLLLTACETGKRSVDEPVPTSVDLNPDQVYWGDLHVHSSMSFDSYSFGNKNLSADAAYRFAKGETVVAHNGDRARLRRPLDFLMVSDHAEYLGVLAGLDNDAPELEGNTLAERWGRYNAAGDLSSILAEYIGSINDPASLQDYVPEAFIRSSWRELIDTAERHNEPGRFTALIGYEWTSMTDGRNLHRNVVFRDGGARAGQVVPFSALDSQDPERLWDFLSDYESRTGGRALAIPHNGNLSNGLMFSEETFAGEPIDRAYAVARSRWEPIYEVTQIKGDAEAHPSLSPEDPFADFENWDETDINMNAKPADQRADMLSREYARPVLKRGLRQARRLGHNPYKFGLIGSTDSHTTLATAEDDNFYGKFPDSEPSPERLTNSMGDVLWNNRELSATGYAAIWSTANTREALFDALNRREVYATTGPRIVLRFFGGWDFDSGDVASADYAERGYRRGVPMGGDLTRPAAVTAPTFMVSAAKDPDGANLDRVQVIKGWIESDGTTSEQVYDVVLAKHRGPGVGADGDIVSTVDLASATYSNTVGAADLAAVWTDPDFDPAQAAFYYARVIQISTPRWTTYDAVRYGVDRPDDVPAEIQERAYSSPIWYTPDQ